VEARKKGGGNRTKEQSCQALADCPARRGGLSARATRTVRPGAADSPAGCHGQSENATRTTRDEPGKTDRPRIPGGPSARVLDRPQTSCNKNLKQNRIKPKQNKNTNNTTTNWAELVARGQSAERGRTVRQFKQSGTIPSTRSQLHPLITGFPKR
jgi:hypothetical protein